MPRRRYAVWDIKCKAAGLPLYQIIGGKTQKELLSYVSCADSAYGENEMEALALGGLRILREEEKARLLPESGDT